MFDETFALVPAESPEEAQRVMVNRRLQQANSLAQPTTATLGLLSKLGLGPHAAQQREINLSNGETQVAATRIQNQSLIHLASALEQHNLMQVKNELQNLRDVRNRQLLTARTVSVLTQLQTMASFVDCQIKQSQSLNDPDTRAQTDACIRQVFGKMRAQLCAEMSRVDHA